MHTVELLEHSLDLAKRLGYVVRQESLSGMGGGACELNGRKLFFLDVGLDSHDQLDVLLDALRREPGLDKMAMPRELRELLSPKKTA